MTFTLHLGTTPLLVSMPHIGTEIPAELHNSFVPRALGVEDTDWHLSRLYNCVAELGASLLLPRISRYVIDLNRPPDDAPMYPGASNTELCPTRFFTGEPLYREGAAPGTDECLHRRTTYWHPYHGAMAAELQRIRAIHGYALLWDAHSIRSQIPWLFEGTLPALNIGTANGTSAASSISNAIARVCVQNTQISHVVNGRFKGGYITRHYGVPGQGVHAVQLEMCQNLYMQESAPFAYDEAKAGLIQPFLKTMLGAAMAACKELYAR